MKNMIKAKVIAAVALLGFGFSSCNDWLEVKMQDKIMENALFADYKGYMTALNGVYIGMLDLYSRSLTTGALDVMAQYYNVSQNNNHSMKLYATYLYSDPSIETATTSIWNQAYTLLANTNVIIEHTDNDMLTPQQHAVIRGEALALRAFIHFDLLRLYGPIFSEDSKKVCIPYQASSKREIQPMLPADEVLEKVIADLREAESLLVLHDPIITEGVKNSSVSDDGATSYDMSFRQLRLNYYAVQVLLARAYMWKGDNATAYKIAKEQILDKITTKDLEVFPWVTKEQTEINGRPDLLFSSEVMFSLYNSKRTDIYNGYFAASLRALSGRLTFFGSGFSGDSKIATFYDDESDFRLKAWEVVEPTDAERQEAESKGEVAPNTLIFKKYQDFSREAIIDGTETYRYMIPLIRLSEVYLMVAECTTNRTEAFEMINTLRKNRDCLDIDESQDLQKVLTYEMAREVIGEGQLFYFYKRRAAESMISGTKADGTVPMVKSYYEFPIPQAEFDKRGSGTDTKE